MSTGDCNEGAFIALMKCLKPDINMNARAKRLFADYLVMEEDAIERDKDVELHNVLSKGMKSSATKILDMFPEVSYLEATMDTFGDTDNDVVDVYLCDGNRRIIGMSLKKDSTELKSLRLSEKTNEIQAERWFGRDGFHTDLTEIIASLYKKHNPHQYKYWDEMKDKFVFYHGHNIAFANELNSLTPSECKTFMQRLLGKYGFLKIEVKTTKPAVFTITDWRTLIGYTPTKFEANVVDENHITLIVDDGVWVFDLRIKNGSSETKNGGLKYQISLVEHPAPPVIAVYKTENSEKPMVIKETTDLFTMETIRLKKPPKPKKKKGQNKQHLSVEEAFAEDDLFEI